MKRSAPGVRFSDKYRTIAESRIVKMLMLAGWAYEQDDPRALAVTQQSLNLWIETGLGVREDLSGQRLFDPVEVVNVLKQLGLEGRDTFWAERYVGTGRRLVTDLAARDQKDFSVVYRRTFNLRNIPDGKSLRLRMPLPLQSIHGDSLEINSFVEGSSTAMFKVTDGRLEARLVTSHDQAATIGAQLRFSAKPTKSGTMPPDKRAAYLRPREGLIVISKKVRELAQVLAPTGTDTAKAVRKFWDYMLDELNCGAMHYDQVCADAPCDTVLETGWYDCQLGSALFIALCRAQNIPARLVGGHLLYHHAPTNHYWAEVWLDATGWTPFDFLSWDLSLGGGDPAWRNAFFGRVDSRMITQLMPFEFTGAIGVSIPPAWHTLQTSKDNGVEISLLAVDATPVYSDHVAVSLQQTP